MTLSLPNADFLIQYMSCGHSCPLLKICFDWFCCTDVHKLLLTVNYQFLQWALISILFMLSILGYLFHGRFWPSLSNKQVWIEFHYLFYLQNLMTKISMSPFCLWTVFDHPNYKYQTMWDVCKMYFILLHDFSSVTFNHHTPTQLQKHFGWVVNE